MTRFLVFIFILFLPAYQVFSQPDAFSTATAAFKKGNYDQVVRLLKPNENTLTFQPVENLALLIKAYNRNGQFNEASLVYENNYSVKYTGLVAVEFLYEAGISYYRQGNLNVAFSVWLEAYMMAENSPAFLKIPIDHLVFNQLSFENVFLSIQEYEDLLDGYLVNLLLEKAKTADRYDEMVTWVTNRGYDKLLTTRFQVSTPLSSERAKNDYQVGLLLPIGKHRLLENPRMDIGRSFLKGFMMASELNQSDENGITFIVEDTEADPNLTRSGYQALKDSKSDMVIGPLFSDECQAIVKDADQARLITVSPTATEDQLFSTSNYFFGLNTTLKTRGRLSALTALKMAGENKRDTLLIVAEDFSSASIMGDAFAVTVEGAGWGSVEKAYFETGSVDIRQFVPIIPKEDTSVYRDFIYAPLMDESEIDIVVGQLSYMKIFGTYIGNTVWDVPLKLQGYSHIIDSMIIVKDYDVEETSLAFLEFRQAFESRFGESPDEYAVRGYDSYLWLRSVFSQGILKESNPVLALRQMAPVKAFHNTIHFNGTHSNQHLQFYQYINRQLVPLEIDEDSPKTPPDQ